MLRRARSSSILSESESFWCSEVALWFLSGSSLVPLRFLFGSSLVPLRFLSGYADSGQHISRIAPGSKVTT